MLDMNLETISDVMTSSSFWLQLQLIGSEEISTRFGGGVIFLEWGYSVCLFGPISGSYFAQNRQNNRQ